MTNQLETPPNSQKILGKKGLIAFIALMNMFIPLSTDMYLPALPTMNTYFNSSTSVTNLTLSGFFLFYAVGILFWGPLSDKFGRRSVLLIGSLIYMVASVLSAMSTSIYFLIATRIFQAIGAGGITSVSMAIIKDCYEGKMRESILAISQSIGGLAPMIAPVIGGFVLQFSTWRGIFWTLAAISVINLVFAILFQDTLKEEERFRGSIFGSIRRLFVVAKNKSFILPALIFSLSALPFMGYLAVSSYIYQDFFGLSAQTYSYYFAANALLSILGPFVYIKFFSNTNKNVFASFVMIVSVISGILMITIGGILPILFWASFALMSLAGSVMRPFSSNLLLDQQEGDAGSTSSLINTLFTVLGSIGMSIASIHWRNIVIGLGLMIAVFSAISLFGWIAFMKSAIPCKGLKESPQCNSEQ